MGEVIGSGACPFRVSAADDAAEKLCELKRILGLPDL